MVSVDQAYMVGHMKNADGSINNKNIVMSAACEAAELFQCTDDFQSLNFCLYLRSVQFRTHFGLFGPCALQNITTWILQMESVLCYLKNFSCHIELSYLISQSSLREQSASFSDRFGL